ncbi:MAG: hypothetical protein R3B52_00275 [Candidatus Paceibacterota bacterium]
MKAYIKLFPTILLALAVLLPQSAKAGFGVSPPLIKEDRLVPGITIEKQVYLVQGNTDKPLPVQAIFDVPKEIEGWLSVTQGEKFTIPAGAQQFPLKVKIKIPDDADLGIYEGQLNVTTIPEAATENGQVSIALGANIRLELTVGDDVFSSYEVKKIDLLSVKENDFPHARILVENTGNVPGGPDAVTFELFSKFGDVRLAYTSIDDVKRIPAFSEEAIDMLFPIDVKLGVGEYWGHVKVFEGNDVVAEQRTVFNVLEKTFFEKNKTYLSVGASLLGLIVIVFAFLKLKRRKRR